MKMIKTAITTLSPKQMTVALSAAMLIGSFSGVSTAVANEKPEKGKCFDINTCKGKSTCATADSQCAGKNSCQGKGWVEADKVACEDKGGRFEAFGKKK